MKNIRKVVFSALLSVMLILSVVFIVATPPSGTYSDGTHWCESSLKGDREWIYNAGPPASWEGPYSCPNGCSGYGTGQNCKSQCSGDGGGLTLAVSDECNFLAV